MEIITDEKIRCVKAIGRLDANSCNDLDQALMALPEKDHDIMLDLSECPYVSSAGIRILLKTKKRLHAGQNELFLTGVVPEVFHVFEVAGLKGVFRFETSVQAALTIIQSGRKIKTEMTVINVDHHQLVYQPTGEELHTGQLCLAPEILSYHELGFALGFGSLSDIVSNSPGGTDFFVTLENCSGFLPSDPATDPDFRIASNPLKTGFPVHEALSFGHQPSGSLKLTAPGILTFSQFNTALRFLREEILLKNGITLVVLANSDKNNPSLSIVLPSDDALAGLVGDNGLDHFKHLLPGHAEHRDFIGITFHLSELDLSALDTTLAGIIRHHLTFENILSVKAINASGFLENPIAWIFHAGTFVDGRTRRLTIGTKEGFVFEPAKAFLARLLYTDSSRLFIDPLHGGYSAQTYHVTSFDHEGRKMRPTVLKIAHRDLISRESERCQQYALPYIFNNCAVVLGAEHFGETMALRYNFVGIGGESNQLKWLTHYYQESDFDFLQSLFDKVFLQILKPWYGQPVPKTIFPFQDHDPTFTFFPHIYKTVSDLFSIGADEQYIIIPELPHPLLNPYWFLKYEFARRRDWSMDYFTGICHGDLNMQNILLDENMNVYLIDFSETKPRSVISDFARLEAIFLIDNAPLDDDPDMADYLNFIRQFYGLEHLNDAWEMNYTGKHTARVSKNAALSQKMRKYAFDSAKGNPDPVPYFIALLEWVLPVVCYTSLSLRHKRLSMIVSSILCSKIMELKFDNQYGLI